jgi:hypothetical protein
MNLMSVIKINMNKYVLSLFHYFISEHIS